MLNTYFETLDDDRKLRLYRHGHGEPVVLLHGYPENLQIWNKLAPLLAEKFEVIAPDWPGMGYSDEWKGGATPLKMADNLAALLAHWHLEKVHLIGQDMGGQPALVFAALYPEKTLSVTVMNSLVLGHLPTSWEIKVLRKFKLNQLLLNHFPGLVFFRALFTFLRKQNTLSPKVKTDMWQAFRTKRVRKFIVRMCAGYEAQLKKLPDFYQKIKAPVFICWGEKDKHFPPVQAQELQRLIPHARLEIIEDGSHWMVQEKAEEVAGKLLGFYEESGLI